MADVGIQRVDDLYKGGSGAQPVAESDHGEVVGVIQELLRNHDLRKVPGARNVSSSAVPGDNNAELFGTFGKYTKRALKFFQQQHGLKSNALEVDTATLRALVHSRPSPIVSSQKWTPSPGRAFLTLYLNIPDSIIFRVITLICSWEESPVNGGFMNWKPQDAADAVKTGLSFGILQFNHGSKQLGELLARFNTEKPVIFNSVFGVNSIDAKAMITFAMLGRGGLNDDGSPTAAGDARFNFQKASLWKKKFLAAGANIELQKLQIKHAAERLRKIHTDHKTIWTRITSERGWGFMLDLANQFGEGGANSRYTAAVTANPTGTEDVLLQFIEKHVPQIHMARRTFFRVDSPLSNSLNFPDTP